MTSNTHGPAAAGGRLDRGVVQHTPGLWQTYTLTDHDGPPACDEVQVQGVRDGVWRCIAQCEWSEAGKNHPTRSEAHANARVMAAAPELLAALQGLLAAVRRSVCDGSGPAQDAAAEALHKAVGAA